jgi:uncharacterized protein (TIGR02145 family)
MKDCITLFSFFCLLIILSSCKKEHGPNPATDYIIYDNGEGTIGAGGGKITLNENNAQECSVSIDIPSGALETPTFISVKDIINELPAEIKVQASLAFEFLPDGLIFKQPVNLTVKVPDYIPLENSSFLGPLDLNSGYLVWYDTKVNLTERTLSNEIDHFSIWYSGKDQKKFNKKPYSYNLWNIPSGSNVDREYLLANDVKRAFKRWEAYSKNANLVFYETTSDNPDILISFGDGTTIFGYEVMRSIDDGLAVWNLFSDKRMIILNKDHQWFSTFALNDEKFQSDLNNNSLKNIEQIITHEIGHFLFNIDETLRDNGIMCGGVDNKPISISQLDLDQLITEYPEVSTLEYKSALNFIPEPINAPLEFTQIPRFLFQNQFKVKVVDKSGNGIPGVSVIYSVKTENNIEHGIIPEWVALTDEMGVASLKEWQLPDIKGDFFLTAKSWINLAQTNSLPKEVVFKVTAKNETGTVEDVDGNVYKTIKIGSQTWMAENLKTTKYNNGGLIGTTSPAALNITSEITPKYQWAYNGDENNVAIYGRLYTWYAITDSRGVCPIGWHVPTNAERTILNDYLVNNGYGYEGGGDDIAISIAANTGFEAYSVPGTPGYDQSSNNSSGFTAVPSGLRASDGRVDGIGQIPIWWSATEYDGVNAYYFNIAYDASVLNWWYGPKNYAVSVRCIMDN